MRREKREFGWGRGKKKQILKGAVICRLFGVFGGKFF